MGYSSGMTTTTAPAERNRPMSTETAPSADDLYREARKAELHEAMWERRARGYVDRGHDDWAEDARLRAAVARSQAVEFQALAEAADISSS